MNRVTIVISKVGYSGPFWARKPIYTIAVDIGRNAPLILAHMEQLEFMCDAAGVDEFVLDILGKDLKIIDNVFKNEVMPL